MSSRRTTVLMPVLKPHRLSYGWNTRKCSYIKAIASSDANEVRLSFSACVLPFFCHPYLSLCWFSQETWYKVSGITHCWCGHERSKKNMDEFGSVFESSGLEALLLSVCYPGSADLNEQHEIVGSVPSCKFDETFCSLIPSWIHICNRQEMLLPHSI